MVDVVEASSIIDGDTVRSGRPSSRPLGLVKAMLIVLCILAPPALIRPSAAGKLSFDSALLADYEAIQADYVFIGNSMLRTRIDEGVLRGRLGAKCCFVLWTAGAESAWMHQALKNIVLAAPHRPKRVFIFFRDTFLTQPTYRATDRYWWRIERLSRENEPDLNRAMTLGRTWQEQLAYRLGEIYPVQKERERASATLSWIASEMVTPGRVPYGESAGEKYDGLFELEKLRSIETDDTAFDEQRASVFDFDAQLPASLLPSMILQAKNAGVPLVFIRVQRRPTKVGPPPQSPQLQAYLERLRAFLTGNGAQLYDFTGDPELTLDRYMDGDHIRADWMAQSTDNFLRRLSSSFQ